MRSVPFLLLCVFAVLVATSGAAPARADTTIRGSWNFSCASTVTEIVLGGSERHRLTFGQAGADSLPRTIRLVLELSAADGGPIPDAWRFDAGGCQGPDLLSWDYFVAAAIKTCPGNMPPVAQTVTHDVRLAPDGQSLRFEFERTFATPSVLRGLSERLVLSLLFDHSASVAGTASGGAACGGVERPVCLRLVEAQYESFAGMWQDHRRLNTDYRANAPPGSDCGPVAARAATWGTIKGQYR